jgi:hypothetical protein
MEKLLSTLEKSSLWDFVPIGMHTSNRILSDQAPENKSGLAFFPIWVHLIVSLPDFQASARKDALLPNLTLIYN